MYTFPRLYAMWAGEIGTTTEENTTARTGGEITAPAGIFKKIIIIGTHIRKKVLAKNPDPADPGKRAGKITRRATLNTNKIGAM